MKDMNGLLIYQSIQTTYDQTRLQTLIHAFAFRSIKVVTVATDQVIRLLETTTPKFFKFAYFFEEDLQLAKALESGYALNVYNAENPINIANDRALLSIAMRNDGLPTPQTILLPYAMNQSILSQYQDVKSMLTTLPYPYLIKERYVEDNQSVYFIRNEQDLRATFQRVGMKALLAQEYVGLEARKIFKVLVIGKTVRVAVEVITQANNNVLKLIKPHRNIVKTAVQATKSIGADIALIHMLVINHTIPYIYGIKTNPDLYELESLSRYPLHDTLVQLISTALIKHE
jgi:glutathione synthase/RimK-type ligase-like ATP-grasp enzyme